MTAKTTRKDRRVERTRQLLQQAFKEIAQEKGFSATSVQDIAERANVNRGTFYLHFADKYMLLDTLVREDMHKLLTNSLPADASWNTSSLHLLMLTLLRYFENKYQHQHHIPQAAAPLVEQAVHAELTTVLLGWLTQSAEPRTHWRVPKETIAQTVGWAIFGVVLHWSQEETTISAEQMADDLLQIITNGVALPGSISVA